jgi:cystathionine beta-synthase
MMPTLTTPSSLDHPLPAVLSLIGNTPLIEITRLDTGPCQLFVKLENQNPTGSIKDRVAHGAIPPEQRLALDIGDALVRLSVGVEDVGDLRADLATALHKI